MAKGSKVVTNGSRYSFDRQYEESAGEDSFSRKLTGINITTEWIENLDLCKVKEIILKMEYKGVTLATSDTVQVKKSTVEIELTGTIVIEDNVDLQFLDDIFSNPVLITVLNPNAPPPAYPATPVKIDLKKKTAKVPESPATAVRAPTLSNILGVCTLDISGLALGKRTVRERLLIDSERKVPPMEATTWTKLPRLCVNAKIEDREAFDEAAKKIHNVLGITIETIFNVPKSVPEGSVFEAIVPAPSLGNRNNTVTFPGGTVMELRETNTKKKWLNLPQFDGLGARSKYCISANMCDVISTLGEDRDFEIYTRHALHVLEWNMWKNCVMTKSDTKYFYSKLIKYRVWPVEICSTSKGKETIQKVSKPDKKAKPVSTVVNTSPDHFIAFVNLSSLLYPGVTKARVAAPLYIYSYSTLVAKFGAENHDSLSQVSNGNLKSRNKSERSKVSVKETEDNKDGFGTPVLDEEGSPVFIIVNIELLEPLTQKQDPDVLMKTLKEYVSLKGELKKKSMSAELTKEKFTVAVKDMISVLSEEYRKYCTEVTDSELDFEEFLSRRRNFCNMQATLENKVVDLINEKFGPMSQCDEVPDMYIYLVNEMHKITNCCVMNQEDTPTIFNIDHYHLFAEEALEEGEIELAKDYLFRKLSYGMTCPEYWLDCAVFFNTIDETEKAIEAVREALFLDFNHEMGLFLYALLMEKSQNFEISELAFQALLTKYPNFLEGWLALWLFYYNTGNFSGGFVALQTAKQLNNELSICMQESSSFDEKFEEKTQSENRTENEEVGEGEEMVDEEEDDRKLDNDGFFRIYTPAHPNLSGHNKYGIGSFRNGQTMSEPLAWTTKFCPPNCIYIRMAILMMRLGFYEFSSLCLTQYMYPCTYGDKKKPYYHYYKAVNSYLLGCPYDAIPQLQSFVKDYGKDCYVWGLMGHCFYKLENHAQAIACYEYVIESFNRPDDIHLIFLRMGNYYIRAKKYQCAKNVLTTACKYSPTPKLWKGLGIACLRLKEAEEAETALSEANYLDNRDAETWAYLALTNALLGRLYLFKNCFMEAKKRNLENEELIQEVETCALLNGLEEDEFACFMK